MSGENNNAIGALEYVVQDHLKSIAPSKDRKGTWAHNKIPERSFSSATQKMFEMMNTPSTSDMSNRNFDDSNTVIGFKTIKFKKKSIRFVEHSFPCEYTVKH